MATWLVIFRRDKRESRTHWARKYLVHRARQNERWLLETHRLHGQLCLGHV
jgi:hypothetical protein